MNTNTKLFSNFFERIMQIIDFYNINSINEFALKYLGYDSSEKINRLKKQGSAPSYQILCDISNKFEEISPDWLLTGKGSMLRNENKGMVSKEPAYEVKEPVQTYYTHEDGIKAQIATADTSKGIPLIPIEAMAGFGAGEQVAMEYECERYVVPMFRGAEFLIPVKGSSMIPKYNSGDIVACKRLDTQSIFFQWNKVYVLDTEQGALIKRVKQGSDAEHILIVSENPNYEPFELHLSQVYSVALVMGVIRLE